ncbi:MAG: Rieske 2Fe-2S domain-containing protein [Candidatus Marinimicrobia bacterium]|nr:Rieske 2Fe-2S domain-containing protein [Candidatus Neomarinimicrobiota bacterium]
MSEPEFILVCNQSEIARGAAKNVILNDVEIAIFNTPQGFIARSGVCKHNAFKLELCEISGDIISCPLHGWKYRISTGKGIKPSWTCLELYPLEVRGDEIWVQPLADDSNKDDFDTSSYQW